MQAKGLSALAGAKAAQLGTPCPIKLVTAVMCRAMDKPGSQGVYTSRCLSFGDSWEDPSGKCQGRQPDSGNPTVRDETGGLRKRDAWSDGHLPRSWKRRIQWKPVGLHMRAPQLYPNCGGGRVTGRSTATAEQWPTDGESGSERWRKYRHP